MAIQRILVVDDSQTDRYYIADILMRHGFVVSTAANGDEALAKIAADRPELVLMDVVMPGQNGFQVTRRIARDPALAVPVVICSSKAQDSDRIWGLRQGAADYLVKPVAEPRLLDCIARIAGGDRSKESTLHE